jgi:hypothetical protein
VTGLPAGALGIDYAGFRLDSPAKVTAAKEAGCRFVTRYSAGVGNHEADTQWKLCGPTEITSIVAAGFDFIANSEWYETRVTEGAAAGHADGAADLAFWKARGYAKGAVIVVSWDAPPVLAKYAAVAEYLAAYKAALAGYYTLGLYGGSAAIREMKRRGIIAVGWMIASTSFSDTPLPYKPTRAQIAAAVANPPAGVDMWQTGNGWFPDHVGNAQADEDVVLRAGIMSHRAALAAATVTRPRPGPTPAPAPVPLPEPKPYYAGRGYPVGIADRAGEYLLELDSHGRPVIARDGKVVAYVNTVQGAPK